MPWIRSCFLFQVFLSIGGVTKFIPSTGVTIPLVSYGGTSVISTLIIFNIIQGLHMLADSEEEEYEHIKAQESEKQIYKTKQPKESVR